jgi:hypothetical protein
VAPYSYDWIDNRGRRSPPQLIPGLDKLEIGQRIMIIFRLIAFVPNDHLTIAMTDPRMNSIFGDVIASFVVRATSSASHDPSTRLLIKICVRYPRGLRGIMLRWFLPFGDMIMVRKQLLTLKMYAERDQARGYP